MNIVGTLERYDVEELNDKPTLAQGQADDLKVDEDGYRWWLTRCSRADGQTHPIMVEKYDRNSGRWELVHQYGDWDEWEGLDEEEEEEEESEPEPEEEDYKTEDHIHFYSCGKMVFEVPVLTRFGKVVKDHVGNPERVNMERALKKHFKSIGFFPNVWFVSDHGNYHLISVNEKTGRYLFG